MEQAGSLLTESKELAICFFITRLISLSAHTCIHTVQHAQQTWAVAARNITFSAIL